MTRSQNSFLNFLTGLFSALLVPLLGFITRSVFLRTLGADYLGIEGLFSNILTMLSLADLGFGVAISYELYKPLEESDHTRIQALMKLYRNLYVVIGFVIVGIGLCLIPVLPYLVEDYETLSELGLNGVLIFLMYLFNTASSYWFFAYKSTLVNAAQKSYILTVLGYAVSIASSVAQILVLTLTHSFVFYLLTIILFTIIRDLINMVICDRRYPYLKEKTDAKISKSERRRIFKDCYAIFLHQANGVVLNASDTVILSAMAGLSVVGHYANYLSIKSAVTTILSVFTNAVRASVGSIFSTGNKEWSLLLFRVSQFVVCWLFGIGAIGFSILADDFISLWIGADFIVSSWTVNGTVIATPIALLIGIEIFIIGNTNLISVFRNASGTFQPLKYRPIASILLNLIISFFTVPYLGIAGCILGTIISLVSTELIIDPIVIYRHSLNTSPAGFFLRTLLYAITVAIAGLIAWWLCSLIPLTGLLGFIVHGCICVAVPCVIFVICFCRTQEFRFLLNTAKDVLRRPNASA